MTIYLYLSTPFLNLHFSLFSSDYNEETIFIIKVKVYLIFYQHCCCSCCCCLAGDLNSADVGADTNVGRVGQTERGGGNGVGGGVGGVGTGVSVVSKTGVSGVSKSSKSVVSVGQVSWVSLSLGLTLPDVSGGAGDGDVGGVHAGSALAVDRGSVGQGRGGVSKTGVTGVSKSSKSVVSVGQVSRVSLSLGLGLTLPDVSGGAGDGDVGGVHAGSALAIDRGSVGQGGGGVSTGVPKTESGVSVSGQTAVPVGQVGGVSLGGDSGNNGSNNSLKVKKIMIF